jgi:hypothetical protein
MPDELWGNKAIATNSFILFFGYTLQQFGDSTE